MIARPGPPCHFVAAPPLPIRLPDTPARRHAPNSLPVPPRRVHARRAASYLTIGKTSYGGRIIRVILLTWRLCTRRRESLERAVSYITHLIY